MDLFQGLPADALATVAAHARLRHLAQGVRIFSQGEKSVRAHAVIAGGVRIDQSGSDGAQVVLRLARQAGVSMLGGTAIEFPLRRKDVADISGTTLHTASRILTGWEKAGLLTTRNRHLTVRKPAELLRIAEDLPD